LPAAILFDRGIIFEKVSLQLPYRLNTVDFLYEMYGDAKFIVRRFNKEQLPKGVEAMEGKVKSMATINFERREDVVGTFYRKSISKDSTRSKRKWRALNS